MSSDIEKEIADLEKRIEVIEGILQKCPTGQHWDSTANKCVNDLPPPPPPPNYTKLDIVGATSSGVDGSNVPSNVYDADTTNRFSVKGLGSWIQLDLGRIDEIHKITFDWFAQAGETRDSTVRLAFPDNPAASGIEHITHGQLNTEADVSAIPIHAQFLKIELVTTTNTGQWFSVKNISVYGKPGEQPPPIPPEPTPVPPPEPTPVPPPASETVDKWGVQKIYPDAGAPYQMWEYTKPDDPRFYEQRPIVVSGSGDKAWLSFKSLQQGRIEVLPKGAEGINLDTDIETYNYEKVIKKGYLRKPRNSPDGQGDWGDIEVQWAIRNAVPGSGSYESHGEIVRGGGRQSTNDSQMVGKDKSVSLSCEALSLHDNVYPPPGSNRTKFEKDTKHTGGYTAHDPETKGSLSFVDQVKGYIHKAVFYRVADPSCYGGFAMKLETWISQDGLAGKKFKLVQEYLDNGKWGPTKKGVAKSCGCPDEYPIHSMDILCPGWRIDFFKSFEMSMLSIRSINPAKRLV